MEKPRPPAIGARRLSRRHSWVQTFGALGFWALLVWGGTAGRSLREGSFEIDSFLWFQLGLVVLFSLFAWRSHARLRPYLWKEAFEEGEEWVFRRKGEELRISFGEVEQVALAVEGMVLLRLGAGSAKMPLVLFAPVSARQDGLSVLESMEQKAAKARWNRPEKTRGPARRHEVRRERISSSWTFAIKSLLPWAGFAGLAIWVALSWGGMATTGEWSALKVGAPLLAALVGFIFHHEYLSTLADEVVDGGNTLAIRRLGREHRVPFPEVERLEYRPLKGFHWIVLHLKTPHPLGRKVAFIPDGRGSLYGWNPRLDALAERIGQTQPSLE